MLNKAATLQSFLARTAGSTAHGACAELPAKAHSQNRFHIVRSDFQIMPQPAQFLVLFIAFIDVIRG
jgi:hypothetical protein